MLLELSVPVGALGLLTPEAARSTGSVEFEHTVFASNDASSWVVVSGDRRGSAAASFRNSPALEDVLRVDDTEDGAIYRLSWSEALPELFRSIREFDGALLRASSRDGKWRLAIRFPDRGSMSAFYATYDDASYPITVQRISASEPTLGASEDRLTRTQSRVLRRAWESGYYDVPRRVPLAELADGLDVSDTAASEALRRGTANLLGGYFGDSKRLERPNRSDG